jgi:Glycosyltransferases involved in cell wall biogenesis
MDKYSILIPVHNELNSINILLDSLVPFSTNGHEIIIIDDGSTDGSNQLLQKSSIIKLITIDRNQGKGHALKEGLRTAVNNRIIVYDGDLELNPSDITNLMILEKDNKIRFVMGYRF